MHCLFLMAAYCFRGSNLIQSYSLNERAIKRLLLMKIVECLPTLTSAEEFICIVKASVSHFFFTLRHIFNYNFWMK